MNKFCIVATLASLACCVLIAGCRLGAPAAKAEKAGPIVSEVSASEVSSANAIPAAKAIGSVVSVIGGPSLTGPIADAMRWFVWAGLFICILGGFAVAFGGKATGFSLFAMGVVTTATGVYFTQWPQMTLLFGTAAFVCIAAVVYDLYRDRKRIAGTETELAIKAEESAAFGKTLGLFANIVEKAPFGSDFKQWIRTNLPEEMPEIKAVITPIKEELKKRETKRALT